ncbi:DegT/DnrJ/EryC1/StrS family aminotransferase [bacterium]|nr:MAG: DegT/DnrJ/EryC1/StrS family aminotransferase [bacterium]
MLTVNIPFFRHSLGQPELDAIGEVLQGTTLTTGKIVGKFESCFAAFLGTKYAIGTTSCTGAMHMSLLALGIGPGDEVVTTPMTFMGTSTAIMSAGARPVFVDVEPHTGNLDVSQIEKALTPKTKAILPVHLYGQMCDMRSIRDIANRHGLYVVEDAAHCIEGTRDGIRPGQLGDTACFSFYATKNLTCGEGGAVVTNDPETNKALRLLRLHGMTKIDSNQKQKGYRQSDMIILGWKYNMDNIHAAMLLPQLDGIEHRWNKRFNISSRYTKALASLSDLRLPGVVPNSKHALHLYPIRIARGQRDTVVSKLIQHGINITINFRPVHLLSFFSRTFNYSPGDFPIAEEIGNSTISLPFYPSMPDRDVDAVIEALRIQLPTGT